jgi:hypothetical protein
MTNMVVSIQKLKVFQIGGVDPSFTSSLEKVNLPTFLVGFKGAATSISILLILY